MVPRIEIQTFRYKSEMLGIQFCVYLVFIILSDSTTAAKDYQDVQRLHDYLFKAKRYYSDVKPLQNQDDAVTIDVKLYILSIYGLAEKSQTVTGDVYWDITWKDEMLQWNTSDFNGIDHIYVPTNIVWMPDIVVSNGVGPSKFLLNNNMRTDHVAVLSDGTMGWWPTGDVTVQCDVILTKFPFDEQTCFYEIEQWYMDYSDMVLITSTTGPSLEYYGLNDEWDLTKTSFETDMYADDFGNYTSVRFRINLKRRPSFYVITMLLPVFLLSFLNSFCFLLPPESGEKVGLSMSLFLTFVLMLTIITSDMPSSSRNVFIFEIAIGLHLFNSGINLILGIFIVKSYHTPYLKCVFARIGKLICRKANCVCVKKTSVEDTDPNVPSTELQIDKFEANNENCRKSGKEVADRMDMVLFKCSIVLNLALALIFLGTVLS